MNIQFAKKYEFIKSIIEHFGEKQFTIKEIYVVCDILSKKYNLTISLEDVKCVIADLYDNFEIDRLVTQDNIVCYKNNILSKELQVISCSR